jgi:hypothetical protein
LTLDGSAGGGLFLSGSTISSLASGPGAGSSVLEVTGTNPSIVQTGTFYIDSGPNAASYLDGASPIASLFMSLASGGFISFPLSSGFLDAPNTDLVLAAGDGGFATGAINVLHLEILSAAATNLNGYIDGITGPAASSNASAFPFTNTKYQFNACPVASVNCIILPVEIVPETNPLTNFDVTPRRRRKLDQNVVLPGVAARDF